MVTRDSSWVFIKDYVLQRDVMAAEKKAKFDQLISETYRK